MKKKLIVAIAILCGYLFDLQSAAVGARSLQKLGQNPQAQAIFNNSRRFSTFSSQDPWYKILGISENATQKEVNAAYKVAMKKYHPDINKDPRAPEMAKNINQAKEKADQYIQYKKDNPGASYDNFKTSYANTQNNTYHQQQKDPYEQIIERMKENVNNHPYAKENSLKIERLAKKGYEKMNILKNSSSTKWDKLKTIPQVAYYAGRVANQPITQEVYFVKKAETILIPKLKNQGYSPQQIESKLKTMQNEARIRIENIKGVGHAAYAIPILAYGASKDATTLNSDYLYPDENYFGGMEKIQADEIQESAPEEQIVSTEEEQIVNTIIDEVIAEELDQIANIPTHNNAAQEESTTHSNATSVNETNTESIVQPSEVSQNESQETSAQESTNIFDATNDIIPVAATPIQPTTWWSSLTSNTNYALSSVGSATQSGITLASENPITTGVIVAGITAGVTKLIYDYYIKHYGAKIIEENVEKLEEVKE